MAVLKGSSRSRFSSFDDPNAGVGQLLNRGQHAAKEFFKLSETLFRNSYVEDGSEPVPAFSFFDSSFANLKKPSRRTILTQSPKATVFIKKRMFSSLKGNFDIRFMDEEERLFLRASKVLFRKKCEEIAFYENILSLEGVSDSNGFLNVDLFLDDYIDNFFNILELGFGISEIAGLGGLPSTITSLVVDAAGGSADRNSPTRQFLTDSLDAVKKLLKLREINQRSKSSLFTTWITDRQNFDFAGLGPGTGVIELNLINSLSTTTSLVTAQGACNLTIEDPYRLLMVNEGDIEIAIREAASLVSTPASAMKEAGNFLIRQSELLDRDVNMSRTLRHVSEVNFEFGFKDESASGIIVETQERFTSSTIDSISSNQAFTNIESAKVKQILFALDAYTAEQAQSLVALKAINKNLSPLRRRMRREYLGQSIIQNMDSVHVFMNSDTRVDTPNYSGDAKGHLNTLQNKIDALSPNMILEEWETIGKGAVPLSLYALVRNPATFRGDGVSIFAGLVNKVDFSYSGSSGKFEIKIGCEDNTKYLKVSKINSAPSMLQSEGILEDPLTPFELTTDESSALLSSAPEFSAENKNRMRLLRFNEGPNAGALIRDSKKLWVDQQTVDKKNILSFQHAPGMIYKWKEGIISASMNINSRRLPDGSGSGLEELQNVYGKTAIADPFSGLDAADIISILITGQPYNYASFLKSSMDSGTFSIDNNSEFYFNFLFDFLERQRSLYGNFIPAKTSALKPKDAIAAFEIKRALDGQFKQFTQLQKQLAEAQDIIAQAPVDIEDPPSLEDAAAQDYASQARQSVSKLEQEISQLKNSIAKLTTKDISGLSKDLEINIEGNSTHININNENVDSFNRSFTYMVKRKPEEVRYNQDKNFFIVSDKYDYDTDIQAITRTLKDQPAKLFGSRGSDHKTPFLICEEVAKKIDFELFADPDGNIVFRPPEYNKTPLTLLVKMLRLDSGDGAAIAPDFLRGLFRSRIDLVKEEILDRDLSLKEKGILGSFDLNDFGINLVIEEGADKETLYDVASLLDMEKLKSQAKKADDPDNSRTVVDQFEVATAVSVAQRKWATFLTSSDLIKVRRQIGRRLGNQTWIDGNPDDEKDLAAASKEIESYSSATRQTSLTNDIVRAISERQFLLRTYSKLVDQARGFGEFVDKGNGESESRDLNQNLLSWSLNLGSAISDSILPEMPKFLKELIENDVSNDDGWRSGKRYIINDDVIINMGLSVNEPKFNRVNVTGTVDFVGGSNGSLGGVEDQHWAGATDFDSWRQFGNRTTQDYTRPDMSDSESQLAPYAVFKLLDQRRKIHSGSVTILGNEFYRPGDVVYINNKSMLYYVESVVHSFQFSDAKFTTTLQLSYGHVLGDYLPTPLDVIGKGLLSTKRQKFAEIKSYRNSTPSDNNIVELGTLFVPSYTELKVTAQDSKDLFRDKFIELNLKTLKNIINKAASKINVVNDKSIGKVEIRSYYIKQEDEETTAAYLANAKLIGGWVRDILINGPGNNEPLKDLDGNEISTLDSSNVEKLFTIDIAADVEEGSDNKTFRRFPSNKAWSGVVSSNVVVQISGDQVPAPLNAIDVVFVIKKNISGDQ